MLVSYSQADLPVLLACSEQLPRFGLHRGIGRMIGRGHVRGGNYAVQEAFLIQKLLILKSLVLISGRSKK